MDSLERFMKRIDTIIDRQLSSDSPDIRKVSSYWDLRNDINNQLQSIEKQKRFLQGYDPPRLGDLVPEFTLNEFKLDQTVEQKIDEFGELSDKMDDIKHQLNRIKRRYSELEDELRPILEDLEDHHEKSIQTEKYLVSIKRKGYTRESYKYKQSFEESLTKVNKQTRQLLEDLLKSTKSTSRVLSSVGVQRLGESSFLSQVVRKVKGFFSKVFRSLRKTGRELDTLQNISRKMVRK